MLVTPSCPFNTAQTPLGATWGPIFGFPPYKAQPFVPALRRLGLGFSRITLYWSQLEPRRGQERWDDLDAYLQQLRTPEEGMLTLACASPWATRKPAWVFPSSPASNLDDYHAFVHRVVSRARGRIRCFQAETEPNNAFYWAGSAADYARQQAVFYKAVKDADPDAVVVLAGYDGVFDPTGVDSPPGQEAGIAFYRELLHHVQGCYDLFDLHLYGNPYTIPVRIERVRQWMREAGAERPLMVAEYAGPGFFDFKANRRWFAQLQGPEASADQVRRLRSQSAQLPLDTRLFLTPDDPAVAPQLLRLQMEDLAVRNVLALSSGVVRTAFFSAWQDLQDPDAPNTVLHGRLSLLEHDSAGLLTQPRPLAAALARLVAALAGQTRMERMAIPDQPDLFVFRIERIHRSPLLIAWHKPPRTGGPAGPARVLLAWQETVKTADTVSGDPVEFQQEGGHLTFHASDMPVLLE